MTTNPAPAPITVRARSRVPNATVQPVAAPQPAPATEAAEPVEIVRGDGLQVKIGVARQHMKAYLEANKAKNKAAAVEKAAAKRVEEAYEDLRKDGFAGHVDLDFEGKTYVAGEHRGNAPNYVDIDLLRTLVTPDVFAKLVEVSQQAVKDHCGDLTLQKVLKSGTAPEPKFGIKQKKD